MNSAKEFKGLNADKSLSELIKHKNEQNYNSLLPQSNGKMDKRRARNLAANFKSKDKYNKLGKVGSNMNPSISFA